jgi:2-C-methyl-D-erythritol 4-phosphate cytidylyltransferase
MSLYSIIVAGGAGSRMQSAVPKQFLKLAGKPVILYSVEAFRLAFPSIGIVLVLPKDQQDTWKELCAEYQFNESLTLVEGGSTRFQSVKNGLETLAGPGLVAIHDGVRPLISVDTIRLLFNEAAIHENAVPVISPKDSLRWQDDQGNRVINRDFVKIIQTPQVFELNKLQAAYVQAYEESFTDDATVWEHAGNKVHLADGQVTNLKITTPEDLVVAEALLAGMTI